MTKKRLSISCAGHRDLGEYDIGFGKADERYFVPTHICCPVLPKIAFEFLDVLGVFLFNFSTNFDRKGMRQVTA